MPLLGNEAYILTKKKIHLVHNLVPDNSPSINIAAIDGDDIAIDFPIDGLFNSHIAIFGNTGSGKTNTLAALYQELFRTLRERNQVAFGQNTRFVLFDFNGEYTAPACITTAKTVYNLSTRDMAGDKLPMDEDGLLELEVLSILADATDKTQRPFLRRTLRLYKQVQAAHDPQADVKNILRRRVESVLQMSDKLRAFLLLDYFREILPQEDEHGDPIDLSVDLDWHNVSQEFRIKGTNTYLKQSPDRISDTALYRHVEHFVLEPNLLFKLIVFLYLQLIADVLANRAQNDHIIPVINRLKSKKPDIEKLFSLQAHPTFWTSNVVIVNLNRVSLDMKKTLPLLLAKKLYAEHKNLGANQSLTLIVDEAHNILSTESFREAESWKDYRLETFEEIIKEGRKFGVFVTIASQRPNDISPTITSQAHNYFIHRLINERDLNTIASAVSYIDRVTEESIPTLPTGTCIFSGIASQMPLKLTVRPLAVHEQPRSATRAFNDMVPPQ